MNDRSRRVRDILLDADELFAITGYTRAAEQLAELHAQGFMRARIDRLNNVVLERAHYVAVCEGRFARDAEPRENERPKVKQVRDEAPAARQH